MKAKLQRAEEKRQYFLRLKSNKAAVEEQKAHEIAFINNLVAQNRKHDILEKYLKRHEAIKQNQEEERMRKQEEQKAKEHAAELRRKELETQRIAKLKEMLEKRRLKQSKIEKTLLDKEKERVEAARAKERIRELRLATIEAQFQANKQQVRRRIMQKQEEWCKRHESNLDDIRKKAFEMSVLHFSTEDNSTEAPTPTPYDKAKCCNVCSVLIRSEVQLKSHLRGLKHQQTAVGHCLNKTEIEEFNLRCIVDAPKDNADTDPLLNEERKKLMKKRFKKIKNRLIAKGIEFEAAKKKLPPAEAVNHAKSKIPKLLKELDRSLVAADKLSSLDRCCSELNRIIQRSVNEQDLFRIHDGLSISIKLIEQICQSPNEIYTNASKSILNLVTLLTNAASRNCETCFDLFMSNRILAVLDLLNVHSNVMLCELVPSDMSCKSSQKCLVDWMICLNLIKMLSSIFTGISL